MDDRLQTREQMLAGLSKPAIDDALVEKVARVIDPRVFHDHQALYEYCLLCGDSDEVAQKTADDTHKPDCDATLVLARAVLALPDLRLAGVKEGLESAYREGFNDARRCLSDDEAFCLTEDVEHDAWLDSETHRSLGPRP